MACRNKSNKLKRTFSLLILLFGMQLFQNAVSAQTMDQMWDSKVTGRENPNLQWFKDAKFGMFIHWDCIQN